LFTLTFTPQMKRLLLEGLRESPDKSLNLRMDSTLPLPIISGHRNV
jgi:hypothetical protein